MDKVKDMRPHRPTVKLDAKEHQLISRLANVEGRTLQGIVTLAVRQYAKRKAPAVLTEVYGEMAI